MLKKIITSLYIVLFLFSNANASVEQKKIGKFLGGIHTNMPSWFLNSFLDLNEDVEDLASQDKRLILFMHQDSCPYCNKFVTKNLANKDIQDKLQKHFAIVDINMFGSKEIQDIDGEVYSEKEFAKKLNVQFTPTLIFYNEEGKQILRLNGYLNIQEFNTALDYVKDKKEKLVKYTTYLAENSEKINKTKLIPEDDIFKKSNNFYDNTTKEIAVFFESKKCTMCNTLHNKLLKDKFTRATLKKINVYQVDMNSNKYITSPKNKNEKISTWSKKLNITYTPSIIFFDEKGNEIIRIESTFKNFHFQSIVDYVVSGAYKKEKEFQRYLTKRAEHIREKGIDVDIWK